MRVYPTSRKKHWIDKNLRIQYDMTRPQWKQLASSLSLNLCKPVQNTGNSYSFGHSDSYGHLGFASQKGHTGRRSNGEVTLGSTQFVQNGIPPKIAIRMGKHGKWWATRFRGSPVFIQTVDSTVMFQNGRVDIPSFFCRLPTPCWSTQPRCKCRASPKANFAALLHLGMVFGAPDLINGDLKKGQSSWVRMCFYHVLRGSL